MRRVAAFLALGALAGCSMDPHYSRPAPAAPPSWPQGDQTVGEFPRGGDVAVSDGDRRTNRQTVRVLLAGGEFSLLCRRREIAFRVIGDKEAEMLPRGANYSFIRNPGKQKIQAAVDLA